MRLAAVLLAAATLIAHGVPAARAEAQAASPFPDVPLPEPPRVSHAWAYVTLAGGVTLVGLSYALSDRANARYEAYLRSTEPERMDDLYDETVALDRWSTATLVSGEALVLTGLYLRFLRRPPAARVALEPFPGGCALSLRF